ncbi:beta-galactosidase [Paludisphaera mucosa]|uniref:Beta-galactosidase n=1 Tax=Paludisphaera mucosa TaxID=3030827 RepID=A0ABT6FHW2_9BACT|nr:beta-galactosidase [Paludisphaera mucosa]MDG3006973.1 beta-galactosidase [Paludisphaera mucosa]
MRRTLGPTASLAALAAAFLTASSAVALTVRVEVRNGAPRLVVDGRPVRARMFFGIPGSAPIPIGPEAKAIRFEFVAAESAENGTLHFRCGAKPGEVDVDDLRVVDLGEGRAVIPLRDFEQGPDGFAKDWTFWPTGEQNTVGAAGVQPGVGKGGSAGLRIALRPPAKGGEWPDFHVFHQTRLKLEKGHRYEVTFWVRSSVPRELTLGFYRPGSSFVYLGGPPGPYEDEIKLAADAGVDFVSFPLDLPWPEPGKPADWSACDSACEQVLRVNPRALLLPRVGLYPPSWWTVKHPDAVMKWEDGARKDAVPASPQFREDAAARLRALVEHVEEKFGDHVAGYHPTGQNTGEWFYQETWSQPLSGYAPADLVAWRGWLRSRYQTDDALRKAWSDPAVRLDAAAVPSPQERHAAPRGIFRDPVTEKPILDWSTFQQEAMADCVLTLAKAVREASGGRKLVVFFYGYVFEFGAIVNGPAISGHYALRRVLDSPDVDVLCSPISYFDRGLGQGAPAMTAAESVALAGKMWLNEDDTRTYLAPTSTFPGAEAGADSLEDTNSMLLRNVGQEAVRNFATWWMDLGATGWFNDRRLWDEMRRLEAIDRPLLEDPVAYRLEIAAVLDEASLTRVAAGGQVVSRPAVYEARGALGRAGAPYGQYLLDDVIAGKVDARLYVILDAWSLTAEQRAGLRWATRGKGVVWCYAPGWFDGDVPSTEAMRELTGFDLRPSLAAKAWAEPTEAGRAIGLSKAFGVDRQVVPTFAAADARSTEILARYPDGSTAVALRPGTTGPAFSLFVGAPGLTSELVRLAARNAGVHLYTEVDCNVYAGGPFLVLHASQDGEVRLRLPTDREGLVDALTGEAVGQGRTPSLLMKRGGTRILRFP